MESRILLAADLVDSPSISDSVDRAFLFVNESAVASIRPATSLASSNLFELRILTGESASEIRSQLPETIPIGRSGLIWGELVDVSSDEFHDSGGVNWLGGVEDDVTGIYLSSSTQSIDQLFSSDLRDELISFEYGQVNGGVIKRVFERSQPTGETTLAEPAVDASDSKSTIDIALVTETPTVDSETLVLMESSPIGSMQALTPLATLPSDVNSTAGIMSVPEFGSEFDELTPLEDSSSIRTQAFEFAGFHSEDAGSQVKAKRPSADASESAPQQERPTLQDSPGKRQMTHAANRSRSLYRDAVLTRVATHLEAVDDDFHRSSSEFPSLNDSLDSQLPEHLIDRQFEEMLVENGIIPLAETRSEDLGDDADDGIDYARASRRILSPIILIAIPYVIHRRGRSSDLVGEDSSSSANN